LQHVVTQAQARADAVLGARPECLRARVCPVRFGAAASAAICFLGFVLGACSQQDAKNDRTQVAARVNGREITVHQVNYLLDRAQTDPASDAIADTNPVPRTGDAALDRLIVQEAVVQAAMAQKLDRDPSVLAAMEDARRESLARAYLDQVSSSQAEPTKAQVHEYYLRNPLLFRDRKVYTVRELEVRLPMPAGEDTTESAAPGAQAVDASAVEERARALRRELPSKLQAIWERSHDWKALSDSVRAAGLPFEARTRIEAAEDLPLDQVGTYDQMTEGTVRISTDREIALVLQLMKVAREPIDEARAAPMIRAYLWTKERERADKAEIDRLTKAAEIERIGIFASTDGTPLATKPETNR